MVEAARTMLHASGMPTRLWAEAINTAAYVLNRTSTSSIEGVSPHKLWKGEDCDISKFRTFGEEAYTHIPKETRRKWDTKAKKGFFVGYDTEVKGHRIWFPDKNEVKIRRDIIFTGKLYKECEENKMKEDKSTFEIAADEQSSYEEDNQNAPREESDDTQEHQEEEQNLHNATPAQDHVDDDQEDQEETRGETHNLRDRTGLRKPSRFANYCESTTFAAKCYEPVSYQDAIKCEDSEKWKQAMAEELDSLIINETWILVKAPEHQEVIDNRWTFKVKRKTDGNVERFKARLVARGFRQRSGVDFTETFSPVARFDSIRIILSIAASMSMKLKQFDVNYDVKSPIILAIHIDDGLIVSKHQDSLDMLMNELKLEFNVTASDAHHYLGLQIERLQDGSIFIHQEAYARAVLERYNMEHANPVAIPADRNHQMCITMHDEGEKVKAPYREAVGSLLYLSVATRPDITFAVHSASQYLEDPKKSHWNAVKRILKYLKGTTSHGLYYPSSGSMHLSAYSDSDYAGDVETRRSTTGFILKFGEATVAWNSQKQKVVTLSTTEAEYLASCQTTKEIIWTKSLLQDLMKTENTNTTLHMDNQSAIRLIKNPEFHRRSKHIDVKYHFIREKYDSGTFNLEYVSSEDQQADILTKPLARSNFERQRDMLHVINIRNINNT